MQATENALVHRSAVAETHLVLAGMHIHIHLCRVQFQIEDKGGMAPVVEHIAVGLLDRVRHQFVANHPAVDEEILQVGLAAGERGQAQPTPQTHIAAVNLNKQGLLHKSGPAHRRHPTLSLGIGMSARQAVNHLAVVAQREAHIKTRQGQALDHFLQVIEFRFFRAQKLAPCRCVEEQITHLHRSAARVRRGAQLHIHVAPFAEGAATLTGIVAVIAGERQARHRANRRQRLAAKSQATHPLQVVQRGNFAGGVTRQRQGQIVRINARAVIADTNELAARGFDIDIHTGRTGVEAVLKHFLDHGSRPFDHLAGSDLVG